MAYSLEATDLLTKQIEKFVSLNHHQLIGHLANLEFWTGEVRHALMLIDGYSQRFECMQFAHDAYVKRHQVVNFDLDDTDIQWKPGLKRLSRHDLHQSRAKLLAAWKRFIKRGVNERFLDEQVAGKACEDVGISMEDGRQ